MVLKLRLTNASLMISYNNITMSLSHLVLGLNCRWFRHFFESRARSWISSSMRVGPIHTSKYVSELTRACVYKWFAFVYSSCVTRVCSCLRVTTCRLNSASAATVAGRLGSPTFRHIPRWAWSYGEATVGAVAHVHAPPAGPTYGHRRHGPSSGGWPTFTGYPRGEFSPTTRVSGRLLFTRPNTPFVPENTPHALCPRPRTPLEARHSSVFHCRTTYVFAIVHDDQFIYYSSLIRLQNDRNRTIVTIIISFPKRHRSFRTHGIYRTI
jgi:hypothetical protein